MLLRSKIVHLNSTNSFKPPFINLSQASQALRDSGFALLSPHDFSQLTLHELNDWQAIERSWSDLAPDEYLKDGGKYRKRRHASLIVQESQIQITPYRPHWQPLSYNALHGGINRWFEPCETDFLSSLAVQNLILQLGKLFNEVHQRNQPTWFVEVHQFRIDTANGIGRPTPEGAHRDGVDFVAVLMVQRHKITGGESRVFDATGPQGQRFTLTSPWTLLLLDDTKVIHETTPIQPEDRNHPENSWRDTLVLTYRSSGFLDNHDQPHIE